MAFGASGEPSRKNFPQSGQRVLRWGKLCPFGVEGDLRSVKQHASDCTRWMQCVCAVSSRLEFPPPHRNTLI